MQKTFYTIGYAHRTQEEFLKLLKYYQINCIVDVRTMAYSKFHPQFNKEPLEVFLKQHGIYYNHGYKAFGIIKEEPRLMNEEGYLDFTKVARLPVFIKGIERMEKGAKKGYIICFMCAEKDPKDCHRSTLVGRALKEKGYEVCHILYDGTLETQGQLEEALCSRYFPKTNQVSLFEEQEKEKLNRAYELRSNDIFAVNAKRVLKDNYKPPQ